MLTAFAAQRIKVLTSASQGLLSNKDIYQTTFDVDNRKDKVVVSYKFARIIFKHVENINYG